MDQRVDRIPWGSECSAVFGHRYKLLDREDGLCRCSKLIPPSRSAWSNFFE
ncbi:MAG: hypothetical protein ACAF41_09715 [Leptolyngbya sp. BL-A-14]